MKKYKKTAFIFRRDLRIYDNTALINAIRQSELVIPVFIFDPRQIEPHAYQSKAALTFLLESIKDLQRQFKNYNGRLSCFNQRPVQVIDHLISKNKIEAVFVNEDYTPFSLKRDREILSTCKKYHVDFNSFQDLLLISPANALKQNNEPYTVFTPFYNNARKQSVAIPEKFRQANFQKTSIGTNTNKLLKSILSKNQFSSTVKGGRSAGLKIINNLDAYENYINERDIPYLNATTGLSAHNKFGTCSIREVYYSIITQLGEDHPLIRELYWRDFFTHIAFHFPHVFGQAFKRPYNKIPWENNAGKFRAWSEGRTGFPIVDAGMRELNETGYMHNRVRMVTASFLIKNLLIDWRKGEKYFAQHLVDYDPAVNNGNWQWAASTGCDAQPYFRIFNPWLQQQKFDRKCQYIYRWIPELRNYDPQTIHNLYKNPVADYPAPIVDHHETSTRAKSLYRKISRS